MYSELISATIVSGGPHAAKTSAVKLMRSVKKVSFSHACSVPGACCLILWLQFRHLSEFDRATSQRLNMSQ